MWRNLLRHARPALGAGAAAFGAASVARADAEPAGEKKLPPAATQVAALEPDVDFVCVGAGASGLYMIHKAQEAGFSIRCFDDASEVGGTWAWNRYPGAKCDVESSQYSFTWCEDFHKTWTWSYRYGRQEEIQRYLNGIAEHYGLKRSIQLKTKVT